MSRVFELEMSRRNPIIKKEEELKKWGMELGGGQKLEEGERSKKTMEMEESMDLLTKRSDDDDYDGFSIPSAFSTTA